MKTIHDFSKQQLDNSQALNTKGGSYNIFCEIYIGRQNYRNEPIDQGVLGELMVWDEGLNAAIAKYMQ